MTAENIRTSLSRVRNSDIPSFNILKKLKDAGKISNKELYALSKKAVNNTKKKYQTLHNKSISTKDNQNKVCEI